MIDLDFSAFCGAGIVTPQALASFEASETATTKFCVGDVVQFSSGQIGHVYNPDDGTHYLQVWVMSSPIPVEPGITAIEFSRRCTSRDVYAVFASPEDLTLLSRKGT